MTIRGASAKATRGGQHAGKAAPLLLVIPQKKLFHYPEVFFLLQYKPVSLESSLTSFNAKKSQLSNTRKRLIFSQKFQSSRMRARDFGLIYLIEKTIEN